MGRAIKPNPLFIELCLQNRSSLWARLFPKSSIILKGRVSLSSARRRALFFCRFLLTRAPFRGCAGGKPFSIYIGSSCSPRKGAILSAEAGGPTRKRTRPRCIGNAPANAHSQIESDTSMTDVRGHQASRTGRC